MPPPPGYQNQLRCVMRIGVWLLYCSRFFRYVSTPNFEERCDMYRIIYLLTHTRTNMQYAVRRFLILPLGGMDMLRRRTQVKRLRSRRIKAILGLVDQNTVGKIPLNNNDLVNINNAIFKWRDADIQSRPRVSVTAQISQIKHEPDCFPNQWGLRCLKTGSYVEFLSEK